MKQPLFTLTVPYRDLPGGRRFLEALGFQNTKGSFFECAEFPALRLMPIKFEGLVTLSAEHNFFEISLHDVSVIHRIAERLHASIYEWTFLEHPGGLYELSVDDSEGKTFHFLAQETVGHGAVAPS